MLNAVTQVTQCLGIEDGSQELGIFGLVHRARIAGADPALGRTPGPAGSGKRQAGVEPLGEGLADAAGRLGSGIPVRIRKVGNRLLDIGKDLLENDVLVALVDAIPVT